MRVAVAAGLIAIAVVACYDPTYEGLLCDGVACPDGHACVDGVCLLDRHTCGDGVPGDGEACDDGNLETETVCPYGLGTCSLCNSDCSAPLSLVGPRCGDGLMNPGFEACDDGNQDDCGNCSADCQTVLPPSQATGMLLNVASLTAANEGQFFGLFDGQRPDYVGFEIDTDNSITLPNRRVDISGGAVVGVITALDVSGLVINASDAGGGNVLLTNQLLSGRGNAPIQTNIPAPFSTQGMSGGAGGDCPAGTGCTSQGVCYSNSCQNSVCQ